MKFSATFEGQQVPKPRSRPVVDEAYLRKYPKPQIGSFVIGPYHQGLWIQDAHRMHVHIIRGVKATEYSPSGWWVKTQCVICKTDTHWYNSTFWVPATEEHLHQVIAHLQNNIHELERVLNEAGDG